MKELAKRWNLEKPKFFKKLQNLAVLIGTMAASVWSVNSLMSLELDHWILQLCKYTLAICAAIAMTSQFPVKDVSKL